MTGLAADLEAAPGRGVALIEPDGNRIRWAGLRDRVARRQQELEGPVPFVGARTLAAVVTALAAAASGRPALPHPPWLVPPPLEALPGGTAWVVPTSGTTGRPRLVPLTTGGVEFVTAAVRQVVAYDAADRILLAPPLFHSYGLSQLWLWLRAGATLVLPPEPLLPGDLARLATACDILPLVPSQARRLDTIAARLCTLAGQATDPAWRERLRGAGPSTRFIRFYGLTEATTRVLWQPDLDSDVTGVPIPGVQVWTEGGELVVDGPNVAPGYVGDQAATNASFRDGRLHTGDLFDATPAGLVFLGRLDGVFKRHGERVVPEAIEVVLRAVPGIVDARVRRGPAGEDGEPGIVAELVGSAAEGALRRALRGALPGACLPTSYAWRASIPRTETGKVERRYP